MVRKMLNRNFRFMMTFLLVSGIFSPSSWAEIGFLEMKGVQSLFQPENEHLSPLYGFTYLKTGILPNLRFYGPFGEKNPNVPCSEDFASRKDCPQDFRSALLQKLFPSRDGINFTLSRGMANVATKLEPVLIGKILGLIAQSPTGEDPLRTQLKEVIRQEVSKNVRKEIDEFAEIVVNALRESKARPSFYPKHFVEVAFLTYFWTKANQKEDILSLLNGIHEIRPGLLVSDYLDRFSQIKDSRYSHKDYFDFKNQFKEGLPTPEQIDGIKNDPEKLSFLAHAYSVFDTPMPLLVNYGNAAHKSLGKTNDERKYNTYSDCGETSIRNFFNIVLNDPNQHQFNVEFLLETAQRFHLNLLSSKGKKHEKGLVTYYTQFTDPSDANTEDAADFFSRWVISDLNRRKNFANPIAADPIVYKASQNGNQPVCELKTGVVNFLNVFEALLGDEVGPSSLAGIRTHSDPQKDPLLGAGKRWSRLTQLFSRPGFELDWNIKGQSPGSAEAKEIQANNDIVLQFSINGTPAFEWNFQQTHSSLNRMPQQEVSWKTAIATKESLTLTHPLALAWLSGPENLDPSHLELLWNRPLVEEKARLKMLHLIAEQPSETFGGKLDFNPLLISSVKRWIKLTSPNDLNVQLSLLDFLMNHGIVDADLQKSFQPLLNEYENAVKVVKSRQKTALLASTSEGQVGALRFLFKSKVPAQLESLVRLAMQNDQMRVFSFLMDFEPSLLTTPFQEQTPAEYAAAACLLNFIKKIGALSPQALQVKGLQGSLTQTAVYNQCWDVAEYLYTADPSTLTQKDTDFGRLPVHWAAYYGNLELLRVSPESTFSVKDHYGDTPAHLAADNNQLEFLKALHEKKVPLNEENYEDEPPLVDAIRSRTSSPELIQYLLDLYPETLGSQNKEGLFPVHHLVDQNNAEMLKQILKNHPDEIKRLDRRNRTLAHRAATAKNWKAFSTVVSLDAKQLTQADKNGDTALAWLVARGGMKEIKFLFETCPKVLETPIQNGNTFAHGVVPLEKWDVLLYLIEKGSPVVLAKNEAGETPLHLAADWRPIQVLESYAKKYPEAFSLKDQQGRTPLDRIQNLQLREQISSLLKAP